MRVSCGGFVLISSDIPVPSLAISDAEFIAAPLTSSTSPTRPSLISPFDPCWPFNFVKSLGDQLRAKEGRANRIRADLPPSQINRHRLVTSAHETRIRRPDASHSSAASPVIRVPRRTIAVCDLANRPEVAVETTVMILKLGLPLARSPQDEHLLR